MGTTTLQDKVFTAGPAEVNLVETVDERTKDRTVDFEVVCDAIECERYACTHLAENEAQVEAIAHALSVHGWRADGSRVVCL